MRTARGSADGGIMKKKDRFGSPNPGKPEHSVPWYKLDPWEALDPCFEIEELEPPGIPVALGPGSGGGGSAPDSSSLENLGVDMGALLAARLSWIPSKR